MAIRLQIRPAENRIAVSLWRRSRLKGSVAPRSENVSSDAHRSGGVVHHRAIVV